MKKRINFISISLLIIIVLSFFITYKFVMLKTYKVEKTNIDNTSIFNETINIKYNKPNNATLFEEMSYYNYFEDYINKEDADFNVKYNENGEIDSFYSITKQKQYINVLNIDSFSLVTEKEKDNTNYSTDKHMKKYMNDNKIYNDIDLLKHIKNNYYLNTSIFNSLKTMKINYIINNFVLVALPQFESVTLINGEKVTGYITNIKSTTSIKEIHLLNHDNQYIITLSGNEITTTQFIQELLESISFNTNIKG